MGSLSSLQSLDMGQIAIYTAVIVMALPLLSLLGAQLFPYINGLSPAKAVTLFGVIGGFSGVVSQWIVSDMLGSMNRQINLLELLPAVVAMVFTSAASTFILAPPRPNPVTTLFANTGTLPS